MGGVAALTEREDWRRVEGVDAATPGFPAAGTVDGADVVVFRTPAGYRATARACPHQYADMLAGTLIDDGTALRCPVHAFAFRLSDGAGTNCPGYRLKVYDIVERDGALFACAVAPAAG